MIMKHFNVVASKEIVASFRMNYGTYKMKFECTTQLVEFIVSKYPEYKDTPYHVDFPNDDVVIEFYSLGNLVIDPI